MPVVPLAGSKAEALARRRAGAIRSDQQAALPALAAVQGQVHAAVTALRLGQGRRRRDVQTRARRQLLRQRRGEKAVLDDTAEHGRAAPGGVEVDTARTLRIPDAHVRVRAVAPTLHRRPGAETREEGDGARRQGTDARIKAMHRVIAGFQGRRQGAGFDQQQRQALLRQRRGGGEASDTATDDGDIHLPGKRISHAPPPAPPCPPPAARTGAVPRERDRAPPGTGRE
jgi:hypothetical protein